MLPGIATLKPCPTNAAAPPATATARRSGPPPPAARRRLLRALSTHSHSHGQPAARPASHPAAAAAAATQHQQQAQRLNPLLLRRDGHNLFSSSSSMAAAYRADAHDWAYNSTTKPPPASSSDDNDASACRTVSSPTALAPAKRPSLTDPEQLQQEDAAADAITGLLLTSPVKKMRTSDDHAPAPAAAATRPTVAGYSPELTKALKSVVKIFTTMASPNFSQPWQMHQQTKCTATGFVIAPLGDRRILTNAHAVANQVAIKVRKHGSAQKFNARVLAVGHECDIAMLTVDDEEFWADVQPLEINGLPAMQESVMVVGFPTGGDNVCVTKGVVSRIDRSNYSHGRTTLLAIQVDAAINSGNSGGPVLLGDHVVGIAFQCLTSGENIGYIIPVPVINHFLEDLDRHGTYTGFCELGISWQSLENPDMKAALGMPKGLTGVYVTKTEPMFDAAAVLQAGDVLTSFNGVEIADDGTFLFREAVRINFGHLVAQQFSGDVVTVKVWRGGRALTLPVRVSTPQQLVPNHSHDVKPSYFIYAGMVFTPLTAWYLRSVYGTEWSCKAPIKLVHAAFARSKAGAGEEVVVLSKVLAADINLGYQDLSNIAVLAVNGTQVVNLAHLAHLISTSTDKHVRLELEWNKVLYIDHAKAKSSEATILDVNAVPSPHSKGLMEQPHPGNTPSLGVAAVQKRAAAAADGNSSQSSDEDAELAEAAAAGGGAEPMADDGAACHSKL